MLTSVTDYLSRFRSELQQALVRERVNELSRLSFEEISRIPEVVEEKFRIDQKNYSWIEWRDQLPGGAVQVVVQVWRRGWLGMSKQLGADGFVASPSGEVRPLTSEEWKALD